MSHVFSHEEKEALSEPMRRAIARLEREYQAMIGGEKIAEPLLRFDRPDAEGGENL